MPDRKGEGRARKGREGGRKSEPRARDKKRESSALCVERWPMIAISLLVLLGSRSLGVRLGGSSALVGLEIELDEEEQVGQDNAQGDGVGPHSLP